VRGGGRHQQGGNLCVRKLVTVCLVHKAGHRHSERVSARLALLERQLSDAHSKSPAPPAEKGASQCAEHALRLNADGRWHRPWATIPTGVRGAIGAKRKASVDPTKPADHARGIYPMAYLAGR
jgi:hypothetical protein